MQVLSGRKSYGAEEGFTLIELMVVVLIIGILMAIAIPTYLGAQQSSQDRVSQSNLKALLTAELAYYTSNQHFASTTDSTLASLKLYEPTLAPILSASAPTAPQNPNQIYIPVASVSGIAAQAFCGFEFSASGKIFGIESIESGASSGTYFYEGLPGSSMPTTCATPPTTGGTQSAGGWSQNAADVGF